MKAEVTIKITSGEQVITLNEAEARKMYDALHRLFGDKVPKPEWLPYRGWYDIKSSARGAADTGICFNATSITSTADEWLAKAYANGQTVAK